MQILVTGATGLLGPYLMMEFSRYGDTSGVARSGTDYDCDLTDSKAVDNLMRKTAPRMIVHAAAMTNVDKCAELPDEAVKQNCTSVTNLVRHMPGDCRFVYVSTDMVYSGVGPHRENSRSENPINMYGMSKFMGEFAASKAMNHLIVRTDMFGFSRSERKSSSLVNFLVERFKNGDAFPIFTDVQFSPLYTGTLASFLAKMAASKRVGTFNLGASDGMSKSKFALLLAKHLGLSAAGARPLESMTIKGRASRPLDTRMDITRTSMAFGIALPSIEHDLVAMCEHYKCAN